MKLPTSLIRPANTGFLDETLDWFSMEPQHGPAGNRRRITRKMISSQETGELLVYIDMTTHRCVGFLAGDLLGDGVLFVRSGHRGQGVGTALVQHRIAEHLLMCETMLQVRCDPEASAPFWQKMGFEIVPCGGHVVGRRAIPLTLGLFEGTDVAVGVRFLADDPRKSGGQPALASFRVAARRTPEGTIDLMERVQLLDGPVDRDSLYAEAIVDGQRYLSGNLASGAEPTLGLTREGCGWLVDTLQLDSA
jgi:GNAT superfamily N-acetyltransferase